MTEEGNTRPVKNEKNKLDGREIEQKRQTVRVKGVNTSTNNKNKENDAYDNYDTKQAKKKKN